MTTTYSSKSYKLRDTHSTRRTSFTLSSSNVDDDFQSWFSIIQKQLDRHAPLKTRRVKSQHLPEWCTQHDERVTVLKKIKTGWSHYKFYRNKIQDLIRKAKRNLFLESIASQKDTKSIWKHFRSYTKKANSPLYNLPDELEIS